MGGQACVFDGAAEFSRDLDLLILADDPNLASLKIALNALEAETIAVPQFQREFLTRGHAVHFRCGRADVKGLRVDVMSTLRNGGCFDELWSRRTTIEVEETEIDMLSLPDLVNAKKTQRDKDWPMIRRLVEQAYFGLQSEPESFQLQFLLSELRTPNLLVDLAKRFPSAASRVAASRPAVKVALEGSAEEVSAALQEEESAERESDRTYWKPLKAEIEELRRSRIKPRE
jgi:hypothetical protein